MNKTWTFMLLFFVLSVLTVVVDSIGYSSSGVNAVAGPIGLGESSIRSLISTYGRLMVFRIDGVPALFTIFIIWPITFGIVFIVAEFVVEFLKVIAEAIPF